MSSPSPAPAPAPVDVEETTELALAEKAKLVKSLRRFDMIFFTVCAFVGLDTLGTVASNGPQGFTWLVVLALIFVLPYALLMAEVGSAFTQEGGPYEWVKLAFNRFQGAIAAVLYWVTNPLWVGGSLAFIATDAWSQNIFHIGAGGAGDYIFKGLFIWLSIIVAIISLRRGKWIPNVGAFLRIAVLGIFTITTVIYGIDHGIHGFPVSDLKPTGAIFLALVPLLLFNYVGFELQNGAAEEMQDPQKDVPRSVIVSGTMGVLMYAIPVFAIIAVLPAKKVTGIGGFIDAVTETFTVYGSAQHFLLGAMTLGFIFTLLTSGAVWMIGSDRILAVAAYDGAFPGFFGVFNRKLGTPVRVNVMSGVVATIFMVLAVASFNGGQNAKFVVVLTIAISTTLISYLWIFVAAVKLRYSHGHVYRPYRVPGGNAGIVAAGAITTFWVALGSWVAVFPGTLEKLFGLDYNFKDTWGVTQGTYEWLTLGTLAVVILIAVIGYALSGSVRARRADLALQTDDGSAPAVV
jgi:glutamate:GABA antiporter